jgi:putative membrane protein
MRNANFLVPAGALAGVASGLVASFVMNHFQAAILKVKARLDGSRTEYAPARHGAQQQKAQDSREEPGTVIAAVVVTRMVFNRELRPEEKEPAGNLVHYLFGSAVGGLYGMIAEKQPAARAGYGTLFGSAVWVAADQVMMPALGLAKRPRAYPPSTHLSTFLSHLVYGLTTELVLRVVRGR